ncbi:hypothetical protein CF326_g6571 [Tilletia indica]|nr:hypothetical protein CF326_g6571 [Tilletia indica]
MSRQLALQLDSRRREIDEELEAMMSVLRSHNSTLTSPLVDEEGFPRADIDIHAVRIARNRIAMLRNDRVDITNQMAEAMRQAFLEPPNGTSSTALPNGSGSTDDSASSSSEAPSTSFKPFAQINSVTPGSPADQAGLRQGDLVLSFAGLATSEADDASPAPSLSDLPPLVLESRQIEVIVRSGAETRVLQLTPSSGAGHRGLLGCHLLPL